MTCLGGARTPWQGYRARVRSLSGVRRASVVAAGVAALSLGAGSDNAFATDAVVGAPPRVTMITDSIGDALYSSSHERDTLAQGLDFRLEAQACRKLATGGCYDGTPPSVLETVQQLGPELGQVVVVEVGYNDYAEEYGTGLDAVLAALTAVGVEKVVWVTLRESQSTWAEINGQIRAAATRWPQLTIADWAPMAAANPAWFSDNAHLNGAGAAGFADFLRPVILKACGGPCVPPEAKATMLAPTVKAHHVMLRWRGDEHATSFDVAIRRVGGAWRVVTTRSAARSVQVDGIAGRRMQARVRARNDTGVPGPWSAARSFRI